MLFIHILSNLFMILHTTVLLDKFNPLSPNIHIQILYTNTHTFPNIFSWENLIKDQSSFPKVIIFLILITFAIDDQMILLGENWGWLLLRLTCRLPSNSDGQIFRPVGYLNINCLNWGNIIISFRTFRLSCRCCISWFLGASSAAWLSCCIRFLERRWID